MSSFNHVVLIGRLGKAPEALKTSEKGSFVRLSLATVKKYSTAKGKVKTDTQWHMVYASNGIGKAALEHLKKGAQVCVAGELRNTQWTDKDQRQHYASAVYAEKLIFLGSKPTTVDLSDSQ